MFNDKCSFDLWASDCAAENRAFSAYAKHTQEKEDVVNLILSGASNIELDDDFSAEDIAWIEQEVERRTGMKCSLT
jgi:hypothetical protein